MKTVLTRKGYYINRKDISKKELEELKKELTVTPYVNKDYSDVPSPFKLYSETTNHVVVPRYYGQNNYGRAPKTKMNHEKINIKFNGKLREKQQIIIDTCMPEIKKNGGGLISLHTGAGKCFGRGTKIMMYNHSKLKTKNVENIVVGDVIMGDDGYPRKILSVCSGVEQLYSVISKNKTYVVNKSHILSLKDENNNKYDMNIEHYIENYVNNRKILFGYRNDLYNSDNSDNPYDSDNFGKREKLKKMFKMLGIFESDNELSVKYSNRLNKTISSIVYLSRYFGFLCNCDSINQKLTIIGNISNFMSDNKYFQNYNDLKYDIHIEKKELGKYYGFEIDGNRRFLLDDFTVAHNTVCAINIACRLKLKTLVVVHKTFLQEQWVERIEQFSNANIGLIRQKKIDIENKDIVIGMLQSISMKDYDSSVFDKFGLVIYDECFIGTEKVMTEKGYIEIQELFSIWKNNQQIKILSYNVENQEFEYKNMTHSWKKKKKADKLLKIIYESYSGENRTIISTKNHKYLTIEGYVRAKLLNPGDTIIGHLEYSKNIDKICCYKICKIEKYSESSHNVDVFDIEVEDNHNYTINNLVVHNCHHIGAKVFSRALKKTGGKYTIGLSATPRRNDGMTKLILWYLGPILYTLKRKNESSVIVNKFNYSSDDKLFASKMMRRNGKTIPAIQKMITNISQISSRNIFICNIIAELCENRQLNMSQDSEKRKILVLSHRIEHLKELKKIIDQSIKNRDIGKNNGNVTTSLYIGGMKQHQLKLAEEADIIFGSFGMAEEGLDIPELNTLILATPKTNIIQSVGRILRKPAEDRKIQPMIIDINDILSMFPKWGDRREEFYNKCKYDIHEYESFNKNVITIRDYLISENIIKSKKKYSDREIRKIYMTEEFGCESEDINSEDDPIEKYNYDADFKKILN